MSDQIDILSAIRQIAAERKIDADEIIKAIKDALKTGFKKEYNLDQDSDILQVEFDPEKGYIAVYAMKSVVKGAAKGNLEISEREAKKIDKSLKAGDSVLVDVTPEGDFGRIAAQTARQVILQKLRESEKEAAIKEIKDKIGSIEDVTIQKITKDGDIICEINRARAVMPLADRVPNEFYQLGSRIKVLLKEIKQDERGKYVHISRADNAFLKELFKIEVPEIDSGTVEIVAIARDPGSRAKVAVKSNSEGVDPIGSCIGQKGVRINAISNELKLGKTEEKVDVVLWDEDPQRFIMNSLSPAMVQSVTLNSKTKKATVKVAADQHSLAIGRGGQNAELASKLTGWRIDIVSDQPKEAQENVSKEGNSNEAKAEDE